MFFFIYSWDSYSQCVSEVTFLAWYCCDTIQNIICHYDMYCVDHSAYHLSRTRNRLCSDWLEKNAYWHIWGRVFLYLSDYFLSKTCHCVKFAEFLYMPVLENIVILFHIPCLSVYPLCASKEQENRSDTPVCKPVFFCFE